MITVTSHSSINISSSKCLWFDPFRLDKSYNDADFIFITHPHFDHLSSSDIDKVKKDTTVFVAPENVLENATYTLCPGDKITVGDIEIEAVAAYNTIKPFHPKSDGWLGYIVTIDKIRYYVCGDTDLTDEAKSVKCDVLLVPCGGTYTMDYKDAAKLANIIKPSVAIPTHYGSITGNEDDGEKFAQLLDEQIESGLQYYNK